MKLTKQKIEKILKYMNSFEKIDKRINVELDIDFDFFSVGFVVQIDTKNISDGLYLSIDDFVKSWLQFHSTEIKYFQKYCSTETEEYIIDFKEF